MSVDPQSLGAAPDDDILRMRVRVRPGELLYLPLQACRSPAERSRFLLSLAIQGYMLDLGLKPKVAADGIARQAGTGAEGPVSRGEPRAEPSTGVQGTQAAVQIATAPLRMPEPANAEVLDDLLAAGQLFNRDVA